MTNAERNLQVAFNALKKRMKSASDEFEISNVQDDIDKHSSLIKELTEIEIRIQKFSAEQQKCAGIHNPIIYK